LKRKGCKFGRAEQVTVGVCDQGGKGFCACAVRAVETDQRVWDIGVDRRGDRAGILHLEHRAVVARAAALGRAEQVAVSIRDQPGIGQFAVGAVEGDQRGQSTIVEWRSYRAGILHLEHRAIAVRAAFIGRAEQVAVGVGRQSCNRP
jgi:hypothetical protein